MSDSILFKQQGHIAHISLNRPATGNLINQELAQELKEVCRRVRHDNDIYVVVITGAGEKAFCLGSENLPAEDNVAAEIAAVEKPTIVAINGDAMGQGLELALSCDIRIASNLARFGLPQITRGFLPSDGGTQRLPRIVGRAKALELILTGDIIDAEEALEIGLVQKVVMGGNLVTEVEAIAKAMACKGPLSLKYAKEAIVKGMDLTLEQGLRLETDLYMLLHTTKDRTEGIRSFQQKKTPDFKGK